MKKIGEEKGITLIALIITIVVLLILAVVAIGAAQESNIVGYAQNAATKYEQAQDNEIGLVSTYENILSKYENPKTSDWTTYGSTKTYLLINNNNNKVYLIYEGQFAGELGTIATGTLVEFNNGEFADYTMDSNVRNANKLIISTRERVSGVIASNGKAYLLAFSTTSTEKNVGSTEYVLNNNIDYSSILEQIQ